jgi:hypothetical protein
MRIMKRKYFIISGGQQLHTYQQKELLRTSHLYALNTHKIPMKIQVLTRYRHKHMTRLNRLIGPHPVDKVISNRNADCQNTNYFYSKPQTPEHRKYISNRSQWKSWSWFVTSLRYRCSTIVPDRNIPN